jgi:hypothetical protein
MNGILPANGAAPCFRAGIRFAATAGSGLLRFNALRAVLLTAFPLSAAAFTVSFIQSKFLRQRLISKEPVVLPFRGGRILSA